MALVRQRLAGSVVAIGLVAALGGAMVPLRTHLSVATCALVLVVPVVAAVAVGGYASGLVGIAAGFFVYDFVFIKPYYTLRVGAAENWVALAVYVVVMLVVARVVSNFESARREAQQRTIEARRIFELSDLLVEDRSVGELFQTIVTIVKNVFEVSGVALLVPDDDRLAVVASAGDPLSPAELHQLDSEARLPVSLGITAAASDQMQAVVLSSSGRPIGMLALRGLPASSSERELLRTFANHAAVALERVQLREQAMRAELLEEVDGLRRSLVGAVSHDLRTPLATIKVSATNLLDGDVTFSSDDTHELLSLIDMQADRLDRLVSNLLDMTRIQAGALVVRREPMALSDLVEDAVTSLGRAATPERIVWEAPAQLPAVDVDHVLVRQALANLIENALRHGPEGTPVVIEAKVVGTTTVEVAVMDKGRGVPVEDRATIFEMFSRHDAGGRAGLGLAIAKSFVEAHGEKLWLEDAPGWGARFVFTLPVSAEPMSSDAAETD